MTLDVWHLLYLSSSVSLYFLFLPRHPRIHLDTLKLEELVVNKECVGTVTVDSSATHAPDYTYYGAYSILYSFTVCTSARAVEIFLQALLTRGADYAATRNAKTLTVGHL